MKKKIYVKLRHVEGLHFMAENEAGKVFDIDSKPSGEPVAGPSPTELVLQAAGGCSSMDVVFILRKRKIEVERFEVEVEGIKREEHPRIYQTINLTYRAKGDGLTVAELERAVGLSIDKYCSVVGMLKAAAEINWKCELIK